MKFFDVMMTKDEPRVSSARTGPHTDCTVPPRMAATLPNLPRALLVEAGEIGLSWRRQRPCRDYTRLLRQQLVRKLRDILPEGKGGWSKRPDAAALRQQPTLAGLDWLPCSDAFSSVGAILPRRKTASRSKTPRQSSYRRRALRRPRRGSHLHLTLRRSRRADSERRGRGLGEVGSLDVHRDGDSPAGKIDFGGGLEKNPRPQP